MKPISPVIPGLEQFEVNVGGDQPEYIGVPTLIGPLPQAIFTSRWQLTDDERKQIADGADIYFSQLTFGRGMSPVQLSVGATVADQPGLTAELFRIFQPQVTDKSLQSVLDRLADNQ